MLSTQTTETTEPLDIQENPLMDLMYPTCEGAPSPSPTAAMPFLTTLASVVTTAAGGSAPICDGTSVNCTDMITDQRGATIVSPILLGLTGTVGQIWALVYLHCGTKRQNQRTVFYLLLCILIWTDFFGKLLTTPPAIVSYSKGSWVGGKPMCDFHGFSMVFMSILTHFTVSAMAVERYLGICHGYFYSRNITPSRCKIFFFCIWVFCFIFSVLPLFSVGQFYLQYPFTWCFTNFHLCEETPIIQKIFTTGLGVINVSNLLIIVVCNVFVVGSLLKMRITPHLAFQQGQPHRNRKKNEQELQMVIVLVVITCVFVVSWAPLDMILLTNQAWPPHGNDDHFVELVAIRLCSLNQIIDPFAYIISRVVFRSRFWGCCRRAIMGRGWSRRGEGGSHFQISTLLNNRKFSRASPPKDLIPTAKEVNQDFPAPVAMRKESGKSTRAPSIHKSYYSDSGTGSYSGVDTPLVDKIEEPSFYSEPLQESKGSAIQQSLAKSLSVAIPIPLFTSEQYRVAELGIEESRRQGRDVYCLVDSGHKPLRNRISNPEYCRNPAGANTKCLSDFSYIAINDNDDSCVQRSNSWGCQNIKPQEPECKTQSTQTLYTGFGKNTDLRIMVLKPSGTQIDNQCEFIEPNGNTTEQKGPLSISTEEVTIDMTNENERQSQSVISQEANATEIDGEDNTLDSFERRNKRPHSPDLSVDESDPLQNSTESMES